LKAESRILHRDGRMTAEEEARETKQEQDEGWHEPRFLDYMVIKVKPLPANRILANHNMHLKHARLPIPPRPQTSNSSHQLARASP
jgi:hypothetical protein